MSRVAPLAAALIALASGCRCRTPEVGNKVGEIAIIYDQDGTTITAPNGNYDFGKVSMGTQRSLKLTIQNRGQGALDLTSLEKVSGDAVKIGEAGDAMPVFTVPFMPDTLRAGETFEGDMTFDAPLESD